MDVWGLSVIMGLLNSPPDLTILRLGPELPNIIWTYISTTRSKPYLSNSFGNNQKPSGTYSNCKAYWATSDCKEAPGATEPPTACRKTASN